MIKSLPLAFSMVVLLSSCIKPPDYPDEPVIEYIGINKKVVTQGNTIPDTLVMRISFTDGDGDLTFPEDSIDFFAEDSRTGLVSTARMPFIGEENTANGVSGEITIIWSNNALTGGGICCLPPNVDLPCEPSQLLPTDTFFYLLQIRDRAGNLSNKVQTDSIVILCN